MQVNVVGIKAESEKSFETFKTLRPTGAVTLVHDEQNEYDPFCIRVIYETETSLVCLGYIAGQKQNGKYVGSEIQKFIIENGITTALIDSYGYIDDNGTFNDEHRGHLQSVRLEIDIPDNDSG